MARRSREDSAGALHHVCNRGIAQHNPAEEGWLALRLSCPRDGPDPFDDLAAKVLSRMLDRMHGAAVARLRGARPALLADCSGTFRQ
jgi:hypothetical protein